MINVYIYCCVKNVRYFFLKVLILELNLIVAGILVHSFIADTANDFPPSVSRLYLGETNVILLYLKLHRLDISLTLGNLLTR